MEPRSLLRDYFDVPYLSLSALTVKRQQIIALEKAEGICMGEERLHQSEDWRPFTGYGIVYVWDY